MATDVLTRAVGSAKKLWWYATDPVWREKYALTQRRISSFRKCQQKAIKQITSIHGPKILSGPFEEMLFPQARFAGSCCAQILLGTYEKEINDFVDAAIDINPHTIVDIGAADGYYVCGFATKLPDARIIAFESESRKHRSIRRLVEANNCSERVKIHGHCTHELLDVTLCNRPSVVICDIDGGELDLLDDQKVPALRETYMLIETHDGILPGITDALRDRFSDSHNIIEATSRPRSRQDLPIGISLPGLDAQAAMDEFRGFEQKWLWLEPIATVDGDIE